MNRTQGCILIACVSALLVFAGISSIAQEPHVIPGVQLRIDGKPDVELAEQTLSLELSQPRIGGGIGPYTVFLGYDEEHIYFACQAVDDVVSCKDGASRDFKDSDYIRFYLCVDDDFKDRQSLNGQSDWAIIFTPQDTDGNWKPMVRECPYNGPGHGAIEGDDITPDRASGPTNDGWYLEAALPFALFEVTADELRKVTFGIYFIAGDTDKSGVRTGEMSLPGDGVGNYWESPNFWQETVLGAPYAVESRAKLPTLWGQVRLLMATPE